MAAVPWKVRRRRSVQDRVDYLSRKVQQLKEELRYVRLNTLQTVNRRIETGEVSTLPQLKVRLLKQIEQMEKDLADVRDPGERTSPKRPTVG